MNSYIFVLGRTFDLCLGELRHVLGTTSRIETIAETVVLAHTNEPLKPQSLIDDLGGTIKIAEVAGTVENLTAQTLTRFFTSAGSGLTFGLSVYGQKTGRLPQLLSEIKEELKKTFSQVRFIIPKESEVLSSVVIKKQGVYELLAVFDSAKNEWLVGKTCAFQDVDAWSLRDFGRPFADPKSGMLPPKVARIAVNLASSHLTADNSQQILFDPFCGMGTILAEALLTGWKVIGSDISEEIVQKARKNLDWLVSINQLIDKSKYTLLVSDATHVSQKLTPNSIDAIVTEPFMGVAFETHNGQMTQKQKRVTNESINNTLKGLEKLYIGSLRDWVDILKPHGRLVMVFPEISFQGRTYRVKKAFDTCENLGYTLTLGPFPYSRPQAIVKRLIYVFIKK